MTSTSASTAPRWSPPPTSSPSALQKRFGIIPGITDKNYITNSYHVHVAEQIDAFTKLKFESEFQKLSPGGAISYVEVPQHAGQSGSGHQGHAVHLMRTSCTPN